MKQAAIDDIEKSIWKEKLSKFQGKAKVRLEFLHFPLDNGKRIDGKNKERLKGVFRTQGCLRLEPGNQVPAVITRNDLEQAIYKSRTSHSDLLDNLGKEPPELEFPPDFRLDCLHGRHRIEAAKELRSLKAKDKWWIVDLYDASLGEEARRTLVEQYSNPKNFSEAEIFRNICEYESKNEFAEQWWWSLLSRYKKDELKRLREHKLFSKALKRLRRIPALMWGFCISTWSRIIATKSDEVNVLNSH